MRDVNSAWLASNWYYVFRRFVIFYSIYITFGILLTRPVYFENEKFIFYNYDSENLNAILYLICYIITNAVSDSLSIYFTFKNLEKIVESGRVLFYGAFDLFLAVLFFVPNQIVSCFLWYVKRAENNVEFTGNVFATFFDLTLWPYALVGNVETNTAIGQLFPGQLIITGTVFFPTIALVSVMILYRLFLIFSYYIKKMLIYMGIDELCKKYLEMNSISPFQMQPSGGFGYCNAALVLIFNGILISMVYDSGKALLSSFQG